MKGASMTPSFRDGDYLLVNRLSYLSKSPERGDVVVLKSPFEAGKKYIKRIIGLPGEHVQVNGYRVAVDEQLLKEPYVVNMKEKKEDKGLQWVLEDSQYLVMGDNRSDSMDSRYFWPVDGRLIAGKVWFRYLPLERFGTVRDRRPSLEFSGH